MKRYCIIFFLVFFGYLSANDFRFYTDYASFFDADTPYVELYFMFPRAAVTHQPAHDGKREGKIILAVNIFSDDHKVFSETIALDDILSDDEKITPNEHIPGLMSLHLLPGSYSMQVAVRDLYSGKTSRRNSDLVIRELEVSQLTLSDIQIASYISETRQRNMFTKFDQYDVIPLANPEFDESNGIFYTYFEIYQLYPGGRYVCKSSIRDLNAKTVIENDAVETTASGLLDVVIDRMDVRDLLSGTYMYHIYVKDLTSGEEAFAEKRILLAQKARMDVYVFENYDLYGSDELDSMFQLLKPLMTQNEIRSYRNSKIAGKRRFFVEFWKRRDPDLSTPLNEYHMEILKRVQYADDHFTQFRQGAKSDRGRVLLKYGFPSEVQRSDLRGGTKNYEIWNYEGMRGNIIFVFCDTQGRGYLELIHSNMEGEIYNGNWQLVIQAGARNY